MRTWCWLGALALALLFVGGCNATPINVPLNKDGAAGQPDTFGPFLDAAVGGDAAQDAPAVPQGDVGAGSDAAPGDAGDGGTDGDGTGGDFDASPPDGDAGPLPDGDAGPSPDGDAGPSPDGDAGPAPDADAGVVAVDTVAAVEAGGTGG